MKKLYKFRFDCGRMGELSGLFVADEEDINNVIGETVYFGECSQKVLGAFFIPIILLNLNRNK